MSSDETGRVALICVAGFFALLFIFLSLRRFRRRAILRAMPTTPVAGVFVGDVEVKGRAVTGDPKMAFLSEQPCVQFEWSIREHWMRMRTVTRTDSKGRTTTHVVVDHGSDEVASGADQAPLEVQDETGRVLVQWEGAKVEEQTLFIRRVGESDPIYFGKGPAGAVFGSTCERTFHETGIAVGAPLFVVGYAREREDIVDVEIARGGRKGTATEGAVARHFLISTRDESAVTSGQGMAGWIYALLGMLSLGAFFAVGAELVHARWQLPIPAALAIGVSGFLVLFGSVWSVMIYNEFVDSRNRVIRAAANIDVQLKRRADLVRSLVAVVIGLRDHEARVHTAVAFLRGQSLLESRELASGKAKAAAAILAAIVEGYPELKSSSVFLGLQQSLTECEQRIALARDEFNGTAAGYNARIAVFPVRIIARIGSMHPANFFQAESFARSAPRV